MVLTQQLPTASEEVFPWSLSQTQAADRGGFPVYHHHAGTRRSTLIAKRVIRTKAKQFEEITRLHEHTHSGGRL